MRRGRRLLRQLFGPPPLPVPQLVEAHQLFEAGEFERAALHFERLAGEALELAPPHAPHLWLQAGRARVMAGRVESGIRCLMRALELLAEQQRWEELGRKGSQIVLELRERGCHQEADRIAGWMQELRIKSGNVPALFDPVGGSPQSANRTAGRHPVVLPTRCPACGGPVDPRKVEWVDPSTAECSYCGGMIRAKSE